MIDEADRRRIVAAIASAGLPTGGLALDAGEVVDAMAFDKKVKAGRVRFVLLDGIGRAVVATTCRRSWCGKRWRA